MRHGDSAKRLQRAQVPEAAATCSSANHLVGLAQQQRRNGNAEFIGGLEIDDELEFCRLNQIGHADRSRRRPREKPNAALDGELQLRATDVASLGFGNARRASNRAGRCTAYRMRRVGRCRISSSAATFCA